MISKPFSKMITGVKINGHVKLVFLSLIALAFDYIWLINNQESAPGWDQGYHLSNTFKMYNILDYKDLSLINKLSLIFEVTDNYRGPLTYLLSALVLKVFKY